MKNLHVPDMHCEKCVERITKALTGAGLTSKVNLSEKNVAIEEEQEDAAREILEDLGFSPEK